MRVGYEKTVDCLPNDKSCSFEFENGCNIWAMFFFLSGRLDKDEKSILWKPKQISLYV